MWGCGGGARQKCGAMAMGQHQNCGNVAVRQRKKCGAMAVGQLQTYDAVTVGQRQKYGATVWRWGNNKNVCLCCGAMPKMWRYSGKAMPEMWSCGGWGNAKNLAHGPAPDINLP